MPTGLQFAGLKLVEQIVVCRLRRRKWVRIPRATFSRQAATRLCELGLLIEFKRGCFRPFDRDDPFWSQLPKHPDV